MLRARSLLPGPATSDLRPLGGLNSLLTVTYDVDLSFKLRAAGLRRVWVPTATAYHLGSRHKSLVIRKPEELTLRRRWQAPDLDEYVPTYGAWHAERDRARLEEPAAR